jgi:aminomethyltransferase
MVDFAGWELPVQFAGILAEHRAVRSAAGLFDVSHMGEIHFQGSGAQGSLQFLLTNSIASMQPGDVRYSPMCYPDGGTVDDVLVYMRSAEDYLVVVNASNREKDFAWMTEHNRCVAGISDQSAAYAQLALQGPRAATILSQLIDSALLPQKYYTFAETQWNSHRCILSRTGYTGEDGFEIYLEPSAAPALWDALLEAGKPHGLVPAGLGARDTLRLEAAMPLYGHELTPDISPLEAGLGRFVKLNREPFLGSDALRGQKEQGLARKRVGLELLDRGIAREGAGVLLDDEVVGKVTSGTRSPWLDRSIAMAMIKTEHITPGTQLTVDVRGKQLPAMVVKLPFYQRQED